MKKFGPLPLIIAYPFENHLGYIKRLLRNGNRPLSQAAKRLNELSKSQIETVVAEELYPKTKIKESKNILKIKNCTSTWFTVEIRNGFTLKANQKDQWFMTNTKEIVKFIAAVEVKNDLNIYGSSIKKTRNFFEHPISSSYVNIFSSFGELNMPALFKFNEIKCKMICLKHKDQFVYIPLLHTI